jgi:flavin-dependent dehydrogenase
MQLANLDGDAARAWLGSHGPGLRTALAAARAAQSSNAPQ